MVAAQQSEYVDGVCPIVNGSEEIDRLDFDKYPIWVGPICLIGIYFILRLLAYFALVLLAKKKSGT